MTKKFIKKVQAKGIVDTKKYRYVERGQYIKRLPLDYLDTTRAIDGWEIVFDYATLQEVR